MKCVSLVLIGLALLNSSCTFYRERFTPEKITVTYGTLFIWGEASGLNAQTITTNFTRKVEAQGVARSVDADAVGAAVEGAVKGAKGF